MKHTFNAHKLVVLTSLLTVAITIFSLCGCSSAEESSSLIPTGQVTIALRVDALSLVVPDIDIFFQEAVDFNTLIIEETNSVTVFDNLFDAPPMTLPPGIHVIGFNALDFNGNLIYADALGLNFQTIDNTFISVMKQAPDGIFDVIFEVNPFEIGILEIPALGIIDAAFVISVDSFGNIFQLVLPFDRLVI